MTVTSGFYDSLAGDRVYNSEQMSRLFEGIITDGIFQNIGGGLVVSANSGMNINVAAGRAWFLNTWTNNDSVLGLTVSTADPTLNRIDTVILEVDKTLSIRANSIKMLNGTPATTPVAPTLIDTSTKKQYALADIYVGAGVTVITGANITNKIGTLGTPLISGIIDTIDVSTLLMQFESEFNYWFENLVDQLTGEQVTNLQNQINQLASGWISISGTCVYVSADSPIFVMNVPDADAVPINVGYRIKVTQTTEKMFIVHAKGSPSSGYTPLTLFGGTDFTLTNAAITSPYFSNIRVPSGFQALKSKWSVSAQNTANAAKTTPTQNQWYGGGGLSPTGISITAPIGLWDVSIKGLAEVSTPATQGSYGIRWTLSTASGSESDATWSNQGLSTQTALAGTFRWPVFFQKTLNVVTKTLYYLDIMTGQASVSGIAMRGDVGTTTIDLVSAYL